MIVSSDVHKVRHVKVDRIYCINVESNTEGFARVSHRLANVKPSLTRMDAATPLHPRVRRARLTGRNLETSLSTLARAISHIRVWRSVVADSSCCSALVLHDNVSMLEELKNDWVARLNCDLERVDWRHSNENPEPRNAVLLTCGHGAYAISRRGCETLLKEFDVMTEKRSQITPLNEMLKWLQQQSPLATFQECPLFFKEFRLEHLKNNNRIDKSITLVTMFYDLGKREDNPSRRQRSEYLEHGEFLLSLACNIVFFVEAVDEEYIWQRRRDYKLEHKTRVVVRAFEELPYWQFKEHVRDAWHTNLPVFPHKLTANYSMLMWCKPEFVKHVAAWNPFGTTHFGWMDFGMGHIEGLQTTFEERFAHAGQKTVEEWIVQHTNDKIRVPQKRYIDGKTIFNELPFVYTNILDQLLGTLWTGSKEGVIQYANLFAVEVRYALFTRNFAPTDEPLMTIMSVLYPELFDIYLADWPTLLGNYGAHASESMTTLCCEFETAYSTGAHREVEQIGMRLLEGHEKAKFNLPGDIMFRIYDQMQVSCYWAYRPDLTQSTFYATQFVKYLALQHPDSSFTSEYVKHKDRVHSNFAFLGDNDPFKD